MDSQPLFTISYNDLIYNSLIPPKTYDDIIPQCKDKLNLQTHEFLNLTFLYKDDNEDSVIISSQYDYEEALSTLKSKRIKQLNLTLDNSLTQLIPSLLSESKRNSLRFLGDNSITFMKKEEEELLKKIKDEKLKLQNLQFLISILNTITAKVFRTTIISIRLGSLIQESMKQKLYLQRRSKILKFIREDIKYKKDKEQSSDFNNGNSEPNDNVIDIISHNNFTCAICSRSPIIDTRFKCNECLDFNLCKQCGELNYQTQQHNHQFLIIRERERISYSVLKNHKIIYRRDSKCASITLHHSLSLQNNGNAFWNKAALEWDKEMNNKISTCDSISISNIAPGDCINIPIKLEVPGDILDGDYSCFLKMDIDSNAIERRIKIDIQIIGE